MAKNRPNQQNGLTSSQATISAARIGMYGAIIVAIIGLASAIFSPVVQNWILGKKREPKQPPPPPGIHVVMSTGLPFEVYEKPVAASRLRTPCTATSKGSTVYSFAEVSAMHQVPSSNQPWLLAKPQSLWVQPSALEEQYDLLLEVSLTNRGEPSIAKDWKLCLVDGDKAFRYSAEDFTAGDTSALGGRTSLADVAFRIPVERGRAIGGWLLFRVPKLEIDTDTDAFDASLEFRDYSERQYSTNFGWPPSSRPAK